MSSAQNKSGTAISVYRGVIPAIQSGLSHLGFSTRYRQGPRQGREVNDMSMIDMAGPSEGRLFKKILGSEWGKLHPDIQKRFGRNPELNKPLYYTGHLSELNCSTFGKFLGYLTLPFLKGALLPFNDSDFPVDIQVYSKPNNPSIFK